MATVACGGIQGRSGTGLSLMNRCAAGCLDESLVHQPLDSPDSGPGVTHPLPGRDQVGLMVVQLVLEPPERSLPLQRRAQASGSCPVADALGEVDHVLIPDVGREGIDRG